MTANPFKSSAVFPVILLLLLTALTTWLERTSNLPPERDDALLRHAADYWLENYRIDTWDEKGHLQHQIFGARMTHFPDDETTDLISPRAILLPPDRPRTTVRSNLGHLSSDGETLTLTGKVRVVREAGPGREVPLTIDTEHMLLWPDSETGRGDQAVLIRDGSSRLAGVGFDFDSPASRFNLHRKVHGIFEGRK